MVVQVMIVSTSDDRIERKPIEYGRRTSTTDLTNCVRSTNVYSVCMQLLHVLYVDSTHVVRIYSI
jgi:hypothetical protein